MITKDDIEKLNKNIDDWFITSMKATKVDPSTMSQFIYRCVMTEYMKDCDAISVKIADFVLSNREDVLALLRVHLANQPIETE